MKVYSIIFSLIGFVLTGFIFWLITKYQASQNIHVSFKLIISAILTFFLYISSNLLVVLIHEANHVLTAFFYGVSLYEVIILPLRGFTIIGKSGSIFIKSHIAIAGTLGIVIVLLLVLVVLIGNRKHLKIEIFIPLYIVFGIHLVEEIRYWHRCILNRFGDGWFFLELNPTINYSIALIVISILLGLCIMILSLIFGYFLYKRYNRNFSGKVSEN